MEFGSCDDLGELLHVGWLDIDNIETLILYIEVPQVDPQVITADEGLSVTVYRYTIDMVGVSIRIRLSWNGCNDSVMMGKSRQLQVGGIAEVCIWVPNRTTASSNTTPRR